MRGQRVGAISAALDGADLVWFGIRGSDALTLLSIPEFRAAFSITDPLRAGKLETSVCLETITGMRVDLDAYDIDLDHSDAVEEFRRGMLACLNSRSAVASYRPSHLVSAVTFAGGDDCRRIGMFKERQSAFEHKPWVETELRRWGVTVIPWQYIADEFRMTVRSMLQDGSVVLRSSRGSGGDGVFLLDSPDLLEVAWPFRADGIASVAPFLSPSLPLNVGGCVYADGSVRLHPASVQLIGIEDCTTRRFGYCGNDFVLFGQLDARIQETAETQALRAGEWLSSMGYLGAFGIDLLAYNEDVIVTEINPRLQGSSALSSAMCEAAALPDIVTEHVAAGLGLAPPEAVPLKILTESIAPMSQVIIHAGGAGESDIDVVIDQLGEPLRAELSPEPGITAAPGALAQRLIYDRSVTSDGFALLRYRGR